jgi:hypothetical protein
MKRSLCLALLCAATGWIANAEPRIESAVTAESVACYDFVEVTLTITGSTVAQPLTDAAVTGKFGPSGGAALAVEGFCDAADGSVFRIRFMPTQPGTHEYAVEYRASGFARTLSGRFEATDGKRRGLLRADPAFRGHFQWAGTQERFFWSGLEADGLTRLDEAPMAAALEHLDRYRITGLRVALAPAAGSGLPDLASWGSLERMLTLARARDMAVAVVLPGAAEPGRAGYAVARLAAFSNVIWDRADTTQAADGAAHDPYGHVQAGAAKVLPLDAAPSADASDSAQADAVAAQLRALWQHAIEGHYATLRTRLEPDQIAQASESDALTAYGHFYDFFTAITWWELRPDTALVVSHQTQVPGAQTFTARNPDGDLAVIYVRGGGVVTLKDELLKDQLKPVWFSPRDGGMRNARALRNRVYRTPTADDWVLLFRTPCNCSFRDFDNEFE